MLATWVKTLYRFDKQNNNHARAARLFCIFLCRQCTTTTWKCLISRLMEDVKTEGRRFFFLFLNLNAVPKKSTSGKFAFIWHFHRTGINATKFETGRFHFKSGVSGDVTAIDAKTPHYKKWRQHCAQCSLTGFKLFSYVKNSFLWRN